MNNLPISSMHSCRAAKPRRPVSTYFIVARDPETGKQALPYLIRAQKVHSIWADLVDRLPVSGMLPEDQQLLNKLKYAMVSSHLPGGDEPDKNN